MAAFSVFRFSSHLTSRLLAPVHCCCCWASGKFNPTSYTSQPDAPDLHRSALQDPHPHYWGVQTRGRKRQQIEECVCGAGIRGRSGFTTDTHTETNWQQPSCRCPVMFCIQSHSVHPPKHTTAVPEGWIFCLSSLPLPPLSPFTLPLYL